jgi:hypothetical protein
MIVVIVVNELYLSQRAESGYLVLLNINAST